MKGIGWLVLATALVAMLIPFPGLLWFSLSGLALIWFATPASKRDRRHAKPPRGAEGSDSR